MAPRGDMGTRGSLRWVSVWEESSAGLGRGRGEEPPQRLCGKPDRLPQRQA